MLDTLLRHLPLVRRKAQMHILNSPFKPDLFHRFWADPATFDDLDGRIKKVLFLFACTNSCANPLIYGVFSSKNQDGVFASREREFTSEQGRRGWVSRKPFLPYVAYFYFSNNSRFPPSQKTTLSDILYMLYILIKGPIIVVKQETIVNLFLSICSHEDWHETGASGWTSSVGLLPRAAHRHHDHLQQDPQAPPLLVPGQHQQHGRVHGCRQLCPPPESHASEDEEVPKENCGHESGGGSGLIHPLQLSGGAVS